jgi:hypothetical protein
MLLITLAGFMGSRLIEGNLSACSARPRRDGCLRHLATHNPRSVSMNPLRLVTLDDSGTLARRVSARAMGGVGADARSIRTRCVPTVASNKLLRVARQNHTSCGE